MLGYAYQLGALPLSAQAIETAIALNGEAAAMNTAAFRWGRCAAADPAAVAKLAAPAAGTITDARVLSRSFDEVVTRRVDYLTAYQNAAYGGRYRDRVAQTKAAEAAKAPGKCGLAEAVARNLFKLMAYKDEYEVARLYVDGTFLEKLHRQFEGDFRLEYHLAPPLLASRDPVTGELRKHAFGPWMFVAFKFLARLRRLRGTAFDIFGRTQERRMERALIADYTAIVCELAAVLTPDNHALAVEIASLPEQMRGFGHIKTRNVAKAKAREADLLGMLRSRGAAASAA
jgi:indolepyruvate ferredoxin oxidoreductase